MGTESSERTQGRLAFSPFMNSERERVEQKPDWREEFEREVIRRSGVSNEEAARQRTAPYEPPAFEVQDARGRDEHMVTSREIMDLYRLHAQVSGNPKPEGAAALEPYYEELLERVLSKLLWAIEKEREEAQKSEPFFDQGQQDFARKLEELWRSVERAVGKNSDRFQQIESVEQVIHSFQSNGPLALYLVRDMRNLHDDDIKDFFDRLGEY